MNRIANALRARWVTGLLGALVLCLLIWFFGPALGFGAAHPLDTEIARFIAIAVVLTLWAVLTVIHARRSRKKDQALVEGAAAGEDPEARASAEELALLRDKLRNALKQLRRSRIGGRFGRHLYELPWYMFIGPPGAGKTTALVNSGLKFPLADGERAPLAGVGGTRHCDWWFTDQAVMIDTAGRYTTQDSQASVDASAWLGFLRLLKKTRTRQPLNGVIVALSLSDLATLDPAGRAAHATAIRKRLRELHDELGVRLPVYVMFTKADLLSGFVEFFDPLGRDEREQVWGMTFPRDDGTSEAGAVAGFGAEFDLLLERLNDRMLERLQQETDLARRRLIYGFPQQLASLRDTAAEFLDSVFRPSRLEARPLLRGIYFTSGTQDGTPIDRLLGTLAGQFGLTRDAVTAFSGAGRSYFLTRLVRDVIFGEAGLVSLDPAVERRRLWTGRAVYAGCAVVLLLLTAAWTGSFIGNSALIAHVHEDAAHYEQAFEALAQRGPTDTDLPAALPALDAARVITGGYATATGSVPLSLAFGLYQGDKLHQAATEAYYRALGAVLLPRLLARLEQQMAANSDKPEFLYEALRVYLILGRQGPADPDLIHQWMAADFDASFPGDENQATRDALLQHVDAMLEQPPPALKLDGPLIASVRAVLNREPLAEYSYTRLMKSAAVRDLPEWTIADNMGPGGDSVFALRSGKPLTTGVPGIFTYAGYHGTFLKRLPLVTQDVASDAWVLGRADRGITATLAEAAKLRRDVLGLYLDEYVRRWDAVIGDIAIKPFHTLSEGRDALSLLSAPDSPLRDLLQALDQQTQLSRTAATDAAAGKAESRGARVASKLAGFGKFEATKGLSLEQQDLANILGEGFGGAASGGKPVDPATRVDEHFRWLHQFVAGDADHPTPPLETALQKMAALASGINAAANAANPGQAALSALAGGGGGSAGAAAQLQQIAQSVPGPIAAMLTTVSQSSASLTERGASDALEDAWRSKVLPLCNAAFGRYPFVAGSSEDVPADDFARLLGPGGLIDTFFNENLKPFVDTGNTPWRWQVADHASLGLSPGTLAQFERAATIRDSLFANGGAMQVRFELLPVSLDSRLAKATIEIGGQSMVYDHGPIESTAFQWPGTTGGSLVRVTLTPVTGNPTTIEETGPWALLRLIDHAQIIRSGLPDRFRIAFSSPQGAVEYQLTASSVRNPFTLSALRSFRCPARL